MGKFFTKIFTLILVVLVIYNCWQITLLKREVASLRRDIAAMNTLVTTKKPSESILEDVRRYLENAKKLILKGEYKKADSELQNSINELEKARRDAGKSSTKVIESMQNKVKEAADNLQELINKIKGDVKDKPGGK